MRKVNTCIIFLTMFMSFKCIASTTLHVATTGNDRNKGAASTPLATLGRAIAIINESGKDGEIVIHQGIYKETLVIDRPSTQSGAKIPPLLIRAAENEKVVFDGSAQIKEYNLFEKNKNIYLISGEFNFKYPPQLWETDTKIRYTRAANAESVAAYPAAFCLIDANTMVFSTSDGKTPEEHEIRFNDVGAKYTFIINRDNTIVSNISFVNWKHSPITIKASGCTIDECYVSNSYRAYCVSTGSSGSKISNCIAEDVGCGTFISGAIDTTVEKCRFYSARGAFAYDIYGQDKTGILYYAPSRRGIIRYNLCEGFVSGAFLKGVRGDFIVEHNTFVSENGSRGLYLSNWTPGSTVRYNILAGVKRPLYSPQKLKSGGVFDNNIIWCPDSSIGSDESINVPLKYGTGKNNKVINPMFVDPVNMDFRLIKNKDQTKIICDEKGIPAGAFGFVNNNDVVKKIRPEFKLIFDNFVAPCTNNKEYYFTNDEWNGGETFASNPPDDDVETDYLPEYITKTAKFNIFFELESKNVKIAKIRITLNGNTTEVPFRKTYTVTLPDTDGINLIKVELGTVNGIWSNSQQAKVILANKNPEIKSVKIATSSKGAVVTFETRIPCLATIEIKDESNGVWHNMASSKEEIHELDINMGGTKWQKSNKQNMNHIFSIGEQSIKWINHTGKNHCRIKVTDFIGNKNVLEQEFECRGDSRIIYVATTGEDKEGCGLQEKPFATLQYALDRTLPSDTVKLLPGLYKRAAYLFHGGTEDAPIIIEAEKNGSVILDTMKKSENVLYIGNAPWIVIKGIEFRWFEKRGIYFYNSPNCKVSYCRFWNGFYEGVWPEGKGIIFHNSPYSEVKHVTAFNMEHGVMLWSSPESLVENNTLSCNLYTGLNLIYSAKNTTVRNNALCFNGIAGVIINEGKRFGNPEVVESLLIDYNNYAARVREIELVDMTAEKNLKLPEGHYRTSKCILQCKHIDMAKAPVRKGEKFKFPYPIGMGRFYTLDSWQKASGKDQHSLYADPMWVDSYNYDFNIKKNSPNIKAGYNGADIGAERYPTTN